MTDIVVSVIARVEVPAALWGKFRFGEITSGEAALLTTQFEWDWHSEDEDAFAIVAITTPVLERAALLAAVHGLRAYDALQLATAVAARAADPDLDRFACFDAKLATAAGAEGFTLVP